jgi:lysylphosphatidylglycerol synthetase-like protein (DUF2156 family)
MSGATTIELVGAERAVHPKAPQGRRLRRRHLWLVPGLAIAVFASQLGNANGVGILAMIAFGIAPDLPRLLGSRGRPIHNLLHQPVAAVVALAVSAIVAMPAVWLIGSLVWMSHVVIGWAVGDVPRDGGPRRND